MEKKRTLTKSLAITGTVLAWLPILAPILLSAVFLFQRRMFRFDYLMPMELFFFTVIGGALLIWAGIWAHSRQKLLGWSLGVRHWLLPRVSHPAQPNQPVCGGPSSLRCSLSSP